MPFHDVGQRSLNPLDVASAERFPVPPLPQRQCVRSGQLTGQVQSWYQDLPEDRLNALRVICWTPVFRLTADRSNPLVAVKRSTRTVDRWEAAQS
jgi:hypothetical protein